MEKAQAVEKAQAAENAQEGMVVAYSWDWDYASGACWRKTSVRASDGLAVRALAVSGSGYLHAAHPAMALQASWFVPPRLLASGLPQAHAADPMRNSQGKVGRDSLAWVQAGGAVLAVEI